ncbi:MAG TPA: AraC family transcriptional regulator [Kofleriaceae bacterium]|nr:AraC family transcriptional regulator [Kofleriaceae bacterium]
MSEFTIQALLETATVSVRDIYCRGSCRAATPEESTQGSHFVFPYRGVFVRHVGCTAAVAEANQVLLFSPDEGYRVSHPVTGGDASLSLSVDDDQLRELAPRSLLGPGPALAFARQRLHIDPRTQALVASIRHRLRSRLAEPLEAESLTLSLVQRALGPRPSPAIGAMGTTRAISGRERLVDRAKLVLTADLSRRWTLADVAREVGASPVYLTQVFQQVEGVPLYRYQLRLRLARSLDLLERFHDLSALALELGFSSHSHFSAAFQQTYGRSPSAFRRSVLRPRGARPRR